MVGCPLQESCHGDDFQAEEIEILVRQVLRRGTRADRSVSEMPWERVGSSIVADKKLIARDRNEFVCYDLK